jgi:hypothetical protein
MKKTLILALIALFYIVFSVSVLAKPVPLDQDVGICYVVSPVQTIDIIYESYDIPDSVPCQIQQSASLLDVEKSSIAILNPNIEALYLSHQIRQVYQSNDYSQKTSIQRNMTEEGLCFGPGEACPWTGEIV